jgi:hypothetical protein
LVFKTLDPDPQSEKMPDPDLHQINADPKTWLNLYCVYYIEKITVIGSLIDAKNARNLPVHNRILMLV